MMIGRVNMSLETVIKRKLEQIIDHLRALEDFIRVLFQLTGKKLLFIVQKNVVIQ